MKVKFLDLRRQYEEIKNEINAAVSEVLGSGSYILGENVSLLEAEAARYLGAGHCAGLASGTDAILLGLIACGVSRGDSVVTTPFTFVATVEAVLRAGAEPVFCDIDAETFNMDAEKIEGKISKNTKALLPVHLYGHPADMDRLLEAARKHGLKVVEDACQSFGAEYRGKKTGTLGDCGAFSFFPSKTLGACGDAGMTAMNDERVFEKVKLLRAHGLENGECVEGGYNSRLDEIHAAIIRVKLKFIDRWIDKRRNAAGRYSRLLADSGVSVPAVKDYAAHSFNYYVVKCERRDELRRHLSPRGVESAVYYPLPVHLQKAFRKLGYAEGDFSVAEEMSRKTLALPIYPEISPEEQAFVADNIKSFYGV